MAVRQDLVARQDVLARHRRATGQDAPVAARAADGGPPRPACPGRRGRGPRRALRGALRRSRTQRGRLSAQRAPGPADRRCRQAGTRGRRAPGARGGPRDRARAPAAAQLGRRRTDPALSFAIQRGQRALRPAQRQQRSAGIAADRRCRIGAALPGARPAGARQSLALGGANVTVAATQTFWVNEWHRESDWYTWTLQP